MNRLTIVRRPASSAENINKYEVLETGEQFSSFISNMASAFAEYVKDQELSNFVSSWLADAQSQEPMTELHLDIPTYEESIPEIEPQLTPRQEIIEKLLLRAFANSKSFIWALSDISRERCEGCEIDDPSQFHHDCMMLDAQTIVWRYSIDALDRVDDDEVMTLFKRYTDQELDDPLNGLELLRYECKDSRKEILSRKRDEFDDIATEVYRNYINGYGN